MKTGSWSPLCSVAPFLTFCRKPFLNSSLDSHSFCSCSCEWRWSAVRSGQYFCNSPVFSWCNGWSVWWCLSPFPSPHAPYSCHAHHRCSVHYAVGEIGPWKLSFKASLPLCGLRENLLHHVCSAGENPSQTCARMNTPSPWLLLRSPLTCSRALNGLHIQLRTFWVNNQVIKLKK